MVPGLDPVLGGGIPAGRTTLVNGGSGAGKTVLGMQIAFKTAEAGGSAVVLSLEESAEALRRNGGALGWDIPSVERSGRLRLLSPHVDPTVARLGSFNLGGLQAIVGGVVEESGAAVVVLDALDTAFSLFHDHDHQQDELARLLRWFAEKGITAVLTAKRFSPEPAAMDFLADCVIDLDQRVDGQVTTRRLRVVKYRGSKYASNEHPFVIGNSGIKLIPTTSIELPGGAMGPPVSVGAAELDAVLGGGFRRGSSVLIAGPTGSGKTTLAATFAVAAASAGDRVLYCSYEESEPALITAMKSPGIDLASCIADGTLRIITTMPESMGIEEHLFRVVDAMDEYEPQHVVLDAVTATRRMGSRHAAFDFLVRLVSESKRRAITCVFTSQTGSGQNADAFIGMSEIGVSSLIDAILSLGYVAEKRELKRDLVVVKNRGTAHSHRYHRFAITDAGLAIVETEDRT